MDLLSENLVVEKPLEKLCDEEATQKSVFFLNDNQYCHLEDNTRSLCSI